MEKSSDIYGISPDLVKLNSQAISQILTIIFNQSVAEGCFPTAMKTAKVIPIHKGDSVLSAGNYRPISLLPERFSERTNTSPNARLDISARGVYGDGDKTFFDVRVTHPNAPSSQDKSLTQIYNLHENEKKAEYNDRVLNVEKGTFVPLVYTTSGGMGPECLKLNNY